jgi:hypothetical protein
LDGVGGRFALQHEFSDLPGLWSFTGIGANYTYTDEDSELFDGEGSAIARNGRVIVG